MVGLSNRRGEIVKRSCFDKLTTNPEESSKTRFKTH